MGTTASTHDPMAAQEVADILQFGGFTRQQAEAALDVIRWAGYRIVEDEALATTIERNGAGT